MPRITLEIPQDLYDALYAALHKENTPGDSDLSGRPRGAPRRNLFPT